MRRWLFLLSALAALAPRCPAATPAQYDAALAQVQAALSAARRPGAASPRRVADRVLTPINHVDCPGGAQPVNNRLLLQSLAAAEALPPARRPAAYAALTQQITALRRDVAAAPQAPPAPDPRAPVEAARAVLSAPAYASDPPPPPSLTERLALWLERLWDRLHVRTPRASAPSLSPAVARAIVIALGVAAFALVVWAAAQGLSRAAGRAAPLALDAAEAALVEARDTDSLLALAEQQARAGDHRRAFRLVYVATLVALDTGGVLRFDRSKTNWEYLRALRAAGRDDVYRAMTPLTRDFDRLWYGVAPATAADYQNALAQYQALRAVPAAVG